MVSGQMVIMYAVCFMGAIFGVVLGFIRLLLCKISSIINDDAGTEYRKRKYRSVLIHFIICGLMFYGAFKIALMGM